MRVAVFGLGYVGSVTAACLAVEGHRVVGVDPSEKTFDAVIAGTGPTVEPGLDDIVSRTVATGALRATTAAVDAADSEVFVVCVGTPSRSNGSLDTRHVAAVCQEIGALIATTKVDYPVVMVRSTLLPGSVAEVAVPALAAASGKEPGAGFGVVFCPEFLRESTALEDFYRPPFTVIGSDEPRAAAIVAQMLHFVDAPVSTVDLPTAEALKYACNSFHAVKVAFANEIARFCSAVDVDPRTVMELFVQDTDLNVSPRYLRPGFAFGGSCLPKDVRALVHRGRSLDVSLPMIGHLLDSNEAHLSAAVDAALATGARRVTLLGLSFKAETDDLRESPFVSLAERLIGKGIELRIYDPLVNPQGLLGANRAYIEQHVPHFARLLRNTADEALENAELVLIAVADGSTLETLVAGPPVPVIDLSGSLPTEAERQLRARGTFQGVAW